MAEKKSKKDQHYAVVTAKATAPTPAKASKAKAAKPDAPAKAKRMSAIDAAAKVLMEAGTPMNCQELIGAMAEKKLWTSPGGNTPQATLYSAILREITTKRKDARFIKTERGKFAAKA